MRSFPFAPPRLIRLLTCAFALCGATPAPADDPEWLARGDWGMVASDSPEASRIGADVLTAGGNAFDAAVATSLALGVTRPESTGLGGGGFMLAYVARNKQFVALDFRETAPAGATAQRFAALRAAQGDGPSASIYGGNAIGTPALAAGYAEMARRFGTLPFARLAAPARQLADQGFAADEHYARSCTNLASVYAKHADFARTFAALREALLPGGKAPQAGETVRRPDLARCIGALAERGPSAFYAGEIASAIVATARAADGTLSTDDLRRYRVQQRQPILIGYRDYQVVSMPPPSSGGVCLAQSLQILDQVNRWDAATPEPLRSHLLIEAMKHAFADRSRWLGDPDFSPLPTARILDRVYARRLSDRIALDRVAASDAYGTIAWPATQPSQTPATMPSQSGATHTSPSAASRPSPPPPDDRGTSHLCVADRHGNVVALTETINGSFGSLVMVEPFGIILNNQMDDFTTVPGEANLFGLIQGEANLVAPGKRPLSSMAPTIVLRDGSPVLTLGASGGPRIISSVLQVLLNVIEFRMPLADAMSAFRVHHQWAPYELNFQHEPWPELESALAQFGHRIGGSRGAGSVTAIQFLEDGLMVGASDVRKGGKPAAAARPRDPLP